MYDKSPIDVDDAEKGSNTNPNNIVVLLSPKSQELLKKQLEKLGIKGISGKQVVIKSHATNDDEYVYQPIMDDRVAFRLKGLLHSDKGIAVSSIEN